MIVQVWVCKLWHFGSGTKVQMDLIEVMYQWLTVALNMHMYTCVYVYIYQY